MSRTGKCKNFAHCVRAYRNETITLADDDAPICPECGQPLNPGTGRGGCLVSIIIAIVLFLVLAGVVAGLFYRAAQRLEPPKETGDEKEVEVEEVNEEIVVEQKPSPVPPAESEEESSTPIPEHAPETLDTNEVSVPETIDLDVANAENRAVKEEVLKRIDLMPTISAGDKDQLYVSVERARQMGEIIKIPFGFGKSTLSEKDISNLREALSSPQIQAVMEDPTAVLVILGFADTKGDPDKNLTISTERAEMVLKTLRDELGVLNVMHTVGMGGSTLFDKDGLDKNRVVEIWAVLP